MARLPTRSFFIVSVSKLGLLAQPSIIAEDGQGEAMSSCVPVVAGHRPQSRALASLSTNRGGSYIAFGTVRGRGALPRGVAAQEARVPRRRGRTIGTFIIGACVVVLFVVALFGERFRWHPYGLRVMKAEVSAAERAISVARGVHDEHSRDNFASTAPVRLACKFWRRKV